jgi:hypothetical protein
MERIPATAREVGERRLAAGLLLLGFLLLIPAVVINAPGFGATSPWGRALPFLFVVVTLFGLVVLEGILRRTRDEISSRLGLVSFTLATALWLLLIVLDTNGLPGGRDVERYFILLAFPAIMAHGIALLRTRIVARWVGNGAILLASVTFLRVLPQSQGPLFYEPPVLLMAVALLFLSRSKQGASTGAR